MKTIRIIFLFALALFILVIGCDNILSPTEPELGGSNKTNYGKPYHINIYPIPVPDDQMWVTFGLITDTHIDASYAGKVPKTSWPFYDYRYRDTDNVKRNRTLIHDINIDAYTAGCLGVVHLGDMVDDNNTQNLVAFRQLYEKDYPGHDGGAIAGVSDNHYDAYSQGYRINKPVFPTLGNHDSPYYNDDPSDWHEAADYIADRIVGAPGLKAHYGKVAYIWRWGQYYFIQLGLWAGSYEHESSTAIDYDKLDWLKEWLAEYVGDSGLGVLIFQHYGWDSFSKESRWWSSYMRELEIDVLMRRPLGSGNTVPGDPYNVLGIFTGHRHDQAFPEIFAGFDAQGDSVIFDNVVFRDSGEESGHFGFSIVILDGDGGKLKIHTKNIGGDEWYWWEKDIHLGP